ncbi:uncharacterized protein LOC115877644 [Sitophilus oryzae]|uniref:Uncharacterized protein LOC115877644 n=1 Tax=Sitophilus oryzae TaxID=7048 RepID=A0A6J2XF40_SITOR|nr:uncharacterized protein LOC115877644 [Sitophilus oryzae]XP_030749747.1 uncharacterized protein LOC115877644 [Sitophilus oryzae]XP_030749748.1 uncharacterized protein LOC115877644 [Sitophilus oryzae]XP_030749749.1 uncharacterized protein LOC115877644 [Sitophilus oryzae]
MHSSMANKYFQYLVILSIVSLFIQVTRSNEVDSNIENPLSDVAKEIMKEKNLENIGGVVSSFLQSDGGKQIIGGVIEKITSTQNLGDLAQVLGSLANNIGESQDQSSTRKKDGENLGDVNPMELLSGLGTLVNTFQGGNGEEGSGPAALLQGLGTLMNSGNNKEGNNAGALLQGLGTLLTNDKEGDNENNGGAALLQGLGSVIAAAATNGQGKGQDNSVLDGLSSLLGGQNGQGGINPEMIGNVINMFANTQQAKVPKHKKGASSKVKKNKKAKSKKDAEFDLSDAINFASSLLSKGKSTGSSFMDYIPTIMNTINAFTGPEAQERADSHSGHKGTIPAIIEKFHLFFDNFLHSDMAKKILNYIGSEKAFKVFHDKDGKFSTDKFQSLIENHSFRKHWISQLTGRLIDFLKFIADEKTQNQYIFSGLSFINAFLKSNGFPNNALINIKDPVVSITNFVNYSAKKFLDTEVDSKEYVKPAVLYIKDILKMAKKAINIKREPKELTDRLTDTINMDFIEPITRVNRAYRFAKSQPSCDRYVLCLINQNNLLNSGSLPELNKGLTKGSSLIAAWFISSRTGTSYWDLYSDVTQDQNCQNLHNKNCDGFHEEEIKVTTEYIHTEL